MSLTVLGRWKRVWVVKPWVWLLGYQRITRREPCYGPQPLALDAWCFGPVEWQRWFV